MPWLRAVPDIPSAQLLTAGRGWHVLRDPAGTVFWVILGDGERARGIRDRHLG